MKQAPLLTLPLDTGACFIDASKGDYEAIYGAKAFLPQKGS